MTRYVYAFDTADAALSAVKYLTGHGIESDRVTLVARSDISENELPESLINVAMDFEPSVKRGALFGAATGLVIGIVVPLIPAVGISISPFELIAFVVGGLLLGMWSSSLIGASVPNKLRSKFKSEIDAGNTLVVIESNDAKETKVIRDLASTGNHHLVFQSDSKRVPDIAD